MARLPFPDAEDPALEPLVARIVSERGSLLAIYRMLLHAPEIAGGWLALFTAVRQRAELPGALRELAIMRVAHLTGASYEAVQHAPIALAEGLSPAQLTAVAVWEESDAFSPSQRVVLAYVDAMTRLVQVPEPVFDDVRRLLEPRQLVELTVTIAGYNMVSRVLEALGIHAEDQSGH